MPEPITWTWPILSVARSEVIELTAGPGPGSYSQVEIRFELVIPSDLRPGRRYNAFWMGIRKGRGSAHRHLVAYLLASTGGWAFRHGLGAPADKAKLQMRERVVPGRWQVDIVAGLGRIEVEVGRQRRTDRFAVPLVISERDDVPVALGFSGKLSSEPSWPAGTRWNDLQIRWT